jgi:hypothetical protein
MDAQKKPFCERRRSAQFRVRVRHDVVAIAVRPVEPDRTSCSANCILP